jgi:hypothetical protein
MTNGDPTIVAVWDSETKSFIYMPLNKRTGHAIWLLNEACK